MISSALHTADGKATEDLGVLILVGTTSKSRCNLLLINPYVIPMYTPKVVSNNPYMIPMNVPGPGDPTPPPAPPMVWCPPSPAQTSPKCQQSQEWGHWRSRSS